MSKPTLLFRGPVKTRSGYGAHSRDLLEALYQMNVFDIKIDSCPWGNTPLTALDSNNTFHKWIDGNIVASFNGLPDFYVQVTIPSEFQRFGKFNIGITAGIETTVAPKDWVDGCNRMDLIITTSNFSKEVLVSTLYDEIKQGTNTLIAKHKIEKRIEVLFEGADTKIYNNEINNEFNLDIKEDFAFLFVGHWLKGKLGQDRKDIGMLVRCFAETFKNETNAPALVLKTSSANFSVKEREAFRKKIKDIVFNIPSPPSIYLLFGELSDAEMNSLYNHPKIKTMVSFTKGEGFGRPLLEFTMTGKPVIASNWSGHKDFLSLEHSVLLGGSLTEVDESSIDNFIIKGSKWFTVNYNEGCEAMKLVKDRYESFLKKSEALRIINTEKFTLEKMKDEFQRILTPYINIPKPPTQYTNLILPKLNKIG
jgi:glycosyltransferase involved in cell wall biosynthesis